MTLSLYVEKFFRKKVSFWVRCIKRKRIFFWKGKKVSFGPKKVSFGFQKVSFEKKKWVRDSLSNPIFFQNLNFLFGRKYIFFGGSKNPEIGSEDPFSRFLIWKGSWKGGWKGNPHPPRGTPWWNLSF